MHAYKAIVTEGHGVASGRAEDSPYPDSSIKMQTPYFKDKGIDLDSYYAATLNLSVAPYTFKMVKPEFTVNSVDWAEGFPAEDFSFSKCEILFDGKTYGGLVYYPHPETKIGHFHSQSLIEVITQYIPDIEYGNEVELKINEEEIEIKLNNGG